MSKHRNRFRFFRSKAARDRKRVNQASEQFRTINAHEKNAEDVLLELRDKDCVFDTITRKASLDAVGIDWVLMRRVDVKDHLRELRIHIQHKSSERDANYFRDRNPCVPVWVHSARMSVIDGKISILKLVVRALNMTQSTHIDFFIKKLAQFEAMKSA